MIMSFVLAIVAAANLAVAFPPYKGHLAQEKSVHKANFCVYPDEFVVKNFQVWTPGTGNNRSALISFEYSDESTHLSTRCNYNNTSVNVGPEGLAPRWACDLGWIEFLWQGGTLTLVEKACPYEDRQ
jgi:hypothetical protein